MTARPCRNCGQRHHHALNGVIDVASGCVQALKARIRELEAELERHERKEQPTMSLLLDGALRRVASQNGGGPRCHNCRMLERLIERGRVLPGDLRP